MTVCVPQIRRALGHLLSTVGLTLLFAAGCTGQGSGPPKLLLLEVRGDHLMLANYTVDQSGKITFAGGQAAALGQVQWSGELSPSQLGQIRRLITDDPERAGTPSTPSRVYHLTLFDVQGQETINTTGSTAPLERIYLFLDQAARVRLNTDLDRLPSPSLDQLVPRADDGGGDP